MNVLIRVEDKLTWEKNQETCCRPFTGIVYPKTHPKFAPDLYEYLSSAEHKICYFEECHWDQQLCFVFF